MTKYHFLMWAFGASMLSMAVARPGLRGLPPGLLVLILRMTLPVAPNLSHMLVVIQGSEPWHSLLTSVVA